MCVLHLRNFGNKLGIPFFKIFCPEINKFKYRFINILHKFTQMDNRSKSGTKRRTTRQSRRGISMNSFIFHPTRLSLYCSFSTDSEITPPFHFNSNPYPSSNSSILSSLLNQEDGSIAPNSSSQTLSCESGTSFPHPPE